MLGGRGKGKGRTRGRGRGRGRTARQVAKLALERGMAEVIIGMCKLQQVVETLVWVVVGPQLSRPQHQVRVSQHAPRQAPPFPGT